MAKTYKDLYPHVYSFDNLHAAYLKARQNKRYHREVLAFSAHLEENLIQLQNELIWKTYRTGRYRFFKVYEPKEREVAALPFRDRVVQHALVATIEPIWERRFIFDSYACRPAKGTHPGADRAQSFLRRVKRNHGRAYVLKADISKYFQSIDHTALRQLIRKRIACRDTLWLIDEILDSTTSPGELSPRGLPIGNLTSQLWANVYLHELDEFVKHQLRERLYLRYMDDFVVVHHDKKHLHQVRETVETFLWDNLRLRTNAKTQIFPVDGVRGRALDFLGYRIWTTHRKLRTDSVKRMKRRLKTLQRQFAEGVIGLDRVRASIASWVGHAEHANSHKIRSLILADARFSRSRNGIVSRETARRDISKTSA